MATTCSANGDLSTASITIGTMAVGIAEAAIDQYQTALVWHPDDKTTKGKIADLYLAMAEEHYAKREYALAEARYRALATWAEFSDWARLGR